MIRRTDRLLLRRLTLADDAFILRLLNEPSFIENIADRGVRSTEDARNYLSKGPLAMYEKHNCGLYGVELNATGQLIGMCGILKRDNLDYPDLGFAFFPEYWGRGYAREAAAASMAHAREDLGIGVVAAITNPNNDPSIRLLEKLGFRFVKFMNFAGKEGDTRLFLNSPE